MTDLFYVGQDVEVHNGAALDTRPGRIEDVAPPDDRNPSWRRARPAPAHRQEGSIANGGALRGSHCEGVVKLPEKLQGKVWKTRDGEVTSENVEAVWEAIKRGEPPATAIPGVMSGSDDRVGRAAQLLRKAGLIEFAGGKWRAVVPRKAVP